MTSIAAFMTKDHRDCDDTFVDFENAIAEGDWDQTLQIWQRFNNQLLHHFDMEEKILFPEFEAATGITQGPTTVMRSEHQQMRALAGEIEQAISEKNESQCLGIAETMMMMIQQHNMKEEQMLYPMADQHIEAAPLVNQLQAMD